MRTTNQRHPHLAAMTFGFAGAILLLAFTARLGLAEKQQPADSCGAGYASLCRLIETCTPKGFEDNGTCKWIYSKSYFYWRG